MKTSPMVQNRTKNWISGIMTVALLLFLFGSAWVSKESWHHQLSNEYRQEQIREKVLTNDASNLEWKLAKHASSTAIIREASRELGMIPNIHTSEIIFIASVEPEPEVGIMGFFRGLKAD